MAGPDAGPAIPVWLAEDDLGCIICHELLAWPTTLPCGHSFCRDCLVGLWEAGRRRSCPTSREGGAQPLQLRKNTMLQDLADKYSRAAHELKDRAPVPGPAPRPAPGPRCHTAQLRVGRGTRCCPLPSGRPRRLLPGSPCALPLFLVLSALTLLFSV